MLGIASGALGVGLFGTEFRVSSDTLPTARLVVGGYALVSYSFLIISVRETLGFVDVTDAKLIRKPLGYMVAVVFFVAFVFVIGIFDKPTHGQPSATKPPGAEEAGARSLVPLTSSRSRTRA